MRFSIEEICKKRLENSTDGQRIVIKRILQPVKELYEIDVTAFPIVKLSKLLQFSKAYAPTVVTLSGITKVFRLLHFEKA